MPETSWARLKAHELRDLARRNAVVILPVASIEQHGPHLPVMTDTRLGEEIARRAAELAWEKRPVIWTPVVWSGLSEHHMAFGGTLTISQSTYRALLIDLIDAIRRLGFRDILISNSHGGNIVPTQALLDEIAAQTDATLVYASYVSEAAESYAKILEDQKNLMHAGEGETSMMMACEPDLVDTSDLAALNVDASTGPAFLVAGKAGHRWRPLAHVTPNGVIGKPEKSSAEKGEALLAAGAEAMARLILDPETWAPPRERRLNKTGGVALKDA